MNNQPTQVHKRIELLDIYRGFAIFGIFVVNIVIMNSTFLNQDAFLEQWTSPIDLFTQKVLQLFFYTKFFPIFSLLFGLGIAMQAVKLSEKKTLTFAFFFRRMLILFLIGVGHIVFLWSGDVVHLYAIIGLLTTMLIKRSNTLIIVLAGVFLLFPFYDQVFEYVFKLFNFKPETFLQHHTGATVSEIIKNGTYLEGLNLRIAEYGANAPMLFSFLAPIAMAMFLLGLYLGKNKIYESLKDFIKKIKNPMLWIVVITNGYRLCFLYVIVDLEVYKDALNRQLFIKLMVLSDVAMGLFYLWLLGWVYYKTSWKKLLQPLTYVGRMALTNYILQSAIGLVLFSSIGFRLYETFSPSAAFIVAFGVFILQIFLSKLWLRYFKFGSLEWLWRCLTYGKVFALKKD